MNYREVKDNDGNEFQLTQDEEKFVRAIERLEKMSTGRVKLFANGFLSIRINDTWYQNEFAGTNIRCEGGDGGDRF
jgi:hypothetical protein